MEEYQHNNPYTQPRQTAPNAVASLVIIPLLLFAFGVFAVSLGNI